MASFLTLSPPKRLPEVFLLSRFQPGESLSPGARVGHQGAAREVPDPRATLGSFAGPWRVREIAVTELGRFRRPLFMVFLGQACGGAARGGRGPLTRMNLILSHCPPSSPRHGDPRKSGFRKWRPGLRPQDGRGQGKALHYREKAARSHTTSSKLFTLRNDKGEGGRETRVIHL